MKVLPKEAIVPLETKEAIQKLTLYFAYSILNEATDMPEFSQGHHLRGDMVLKALELRGFDEYSTLCSAYRDVYGDAVLQCLEEIVGGGRSNMQQANNYRKWKGKARKKKSSAKDTSKSCIRPRGHRIRRYNKRGQKEREAKRGGGGNRSQLNGKRRQEEPKTEERDVMASEGSDANLQRQVKDSMNETENGEGKAAKSTREQPLSGKTLSCKTTPHQSSEAGSTIRGLNKRHPSKEKEEKEEKGGGNDNDNQKNDDDDDDNDDDDVCNWGGGNDDGDGYSKQPFDLHESLAKKAAASTDDDKGEGKVTINPVRQFTGGGEGQNCLDKGTETQETTR